jgi:hypothetical protein
MASLDFNGLDAQMQRLSRLGKSIEPAAKKGIKAGAKVIVAALKEAAPRETGGLAESVKAKAPKAVPTGGWSSKILPDGESPSGEPYAKIGNILEYGWSDGSRHYPWFYGTVAAAEGDAKAACAAAAQAELHKGVG